MGLAPPDPLDRIVSLLAGPAAQWRAMPNSPPTSGDFKTVKVAPPTLEARIAHRHTLIRG